MYVLSIKVMVLLSVAMPPIIMVVADESKDIDENCSTGNVHKRAKVGSNFSRRGSWLEPVELGGLSETTEQKRRVRDQFNFYNIRPPGNRQQSQQQYQQQYQPNYDDSEDLYQQPNYPPPSPPQPPYQPYIYPPAQQNTYPPLPYPYSPQQPQQQPQQQPPYQPYVYPPPYYPPSTTTTTTPAPTSNPSPSTPIGYMLIDTYTSKFGSYSRPTAFFMNSR